MDATKITAINHVDLIPGGSLRDATTGAVHAAKYGGAKGVGTWGKVGADNVVRVQFATGGPIVAALYPSALCTLIVPAPVKHTLTNAIDGKPVGAPIVFG